MRSQIVAVAVLAFGGGAGNRAVAASLETAAAVIGGTSTCVTGGPAAPFSNWGGGLNIPSPGISECGVAGGIQDLTAASGPLAASQSLTHNFADGTFDGTASSIATYGLLGVSAAGSMGGTTSAARVHAAAALASFGDQLTISGMPAGTAGLIRFLFTVGGAVSNVYQPPYAEQANVYLQMRMSTFSPNPATVFQANVTNINNSGATISGDAVSSTFNTGSSTTTLTGSGVYRSLQYSFMYGTPFDVAVALTAANVSPCCLGASSSINFLGTAALTGIEIKTLAGQAVTQFSIQSASGTAYGAEGVGAVPEPGGVTLLAGCLALTLVLLRRR